jgi:hypothetical protein
MTPMWNRTRQGGAMRDGTMRTRWAGPSLACVLAVLASGCDRQQAPPQAGTAPAAATTAPAAPAASGPTPAGPLRDVIEHTPSHVVGISYPSGLDDQPGLVALLRGYADAARAELLKAVDGLGNDRPPAPYELSLGFETRLRTPDLIVVAADGSRYTGGAHGEPLVARFVWLPRHGRQLTAQALLADPRGWATVGRYVAAQLHAAAAARAEADALAPQEQAALLDSSDKMIAEGTAADADNFAEFEPLLGAGGRIAALRFVFPPYQVGPYSDGTQTVDVPAAVLRPLLAPDYAPLFAGASSGAP